MKKLKNLLKNKAVAIFLIVVLLIIFTFIVIKSFQNLTGKTISNMENTRVKLETNYGDIIIELYSDMPITSNNFKNLVEKGTYDGVIFHRVIGPSPEMPKGFMIQGGDPTGTGYGDPSIPTIKDEFVPGHSNLRGTISMANAGPNTGSSQFFINLGDNTFLDYDKQPLSSKHPVFGEVVEGMDVVDKIARVKTNSQDRPIEEVKIIKASVIN